MIPDLGRIGFTRNQANVYLALLRAGRSTIQQLANATGLNRVTVHSIVEKFEAMQLCCSVREGNARRILPLDPVCLQFLIEQESTVLAEKQEAYSTLEGELRDLYRHAQRDSQILTLRGPTMYRYLVEDILSAKEETWELFNVDLIPPEGIAFLREHFFPRKHKLGIPSKYFLPDTDRGRELFKEFYLDWPGASPGEAKFVSAKGLTFRMQIVIYAHTVALLNIQTNSGVLIKDRAICDSTRQFFDMFWQAVRPGITNRKPSRG